MKSVLMICYHYPPARNGGVERSLRFSEYLPQYGWQPDIITTDLYGTSPVASYVLEPLSLYKRLRKSYPATPYKPPRTQSAPANNQLNLRQWVEDYLYLPDRAALWLPFALPKALARKTDIIYTTSPPESSHLSGALLKQLKGRPWVMDLRDAWTIEPIKQALREKRWRLSFEERLERYCFHHADAIILNTPRVAEAYQQRYPQWSDKFQVITNGYYQPGFVSQTRTFSIHDALNFDHTIKLISHVGSLTRNTNLANQPDTFMPLLKAIQNIDMPDHRFVFIGNVPAQFVRAIDELNLQEKVILAGMIPHENAVQAIADSDALLFFDLPVDGKTYVRGKAYEYIASQKPIIALAGEGASQDLLRKVGKTLFAHPQEQNEISNSIQQYLNGNLPDTLDFDLQSINYQFLTERLAQLFDGLA